MKDSKHKAVLNDILSGITQTVAGKVATVAIAAAVATAGTGVAIHHASFQKERSKANEANASSTGNTNWNSARSQTAVGYLNSSETFRAIENSSEAKDGTKSTTASHGENPAGSAYSSAAANSTFSKASSSSSGSNSRNSYSASASSASVPLKQ